MPKGLAGGPRSLSKATLEIDFITEQQLPADADIEQKLRGEMAFDGPLDVVNTLTTDAGEFKDLNVVKVITRKEKATIAELSLIVTVVKGMFEQDISNSDIIVRTR